MMNRIRFPSHQSKRRGRHWCRPQVLGLEARKFLAPVLNIDTNELNDG
jgi:hypothetical protein